MSATDDTAALLSQDVDQIHGVRITRGNARVEFERLGEGYFGDFDPDDPEDEELLRFETYRKDESGSWAPCRDGGYCTALPVATPLDGRQQALDMLMATLQGGIESDRVKHIAEMASWISPAWLSDGRLPFTKRD